MENLQVGRQLCVLKCEIGRQVQQGLHESSIDNFLKYKPTFFSKGILVIRKLETVNHLLPSSRDECT